MHCRCNANIIHLPVNNLLAENLENVTHFRAIWISDLHLGTAGCQAEPLLDFLKQHESDTLYLVGDIVDGWQLKGRWYWPQSHNDVAQKILRKARKGTRVIYIPGNHDSFARDYANLHFGGIEVMHETEHITLTGKRLWVTHGDLFDGVIQYAPWLAYVGDHLYTLALKFNRWYNRARARMGLGYWSLSQYLKHKVKNAVRFITAFEEALVHEARQRNFDGVVCGHIHKAEIRDIDGILYCNDGDWVESRTALVEHWDGRLEIITWVPPLPAKVKATSTKTQVTTTSVTDPASSPTEGVPYN